MNTKPTWLYDTLAGHTIHLFLYGYIPATIGITRHTIRVLSKRLNQSVLADQPPVGFPASVGNTLRIRLPINYRVSDGSAHV